MALLVRLQQKFKKMCVMAVTYLPHFWHLRDHWIWCWEILRQLIKTFYSCWTLEQARRCTCISVHVLSATLYMFIGATLFSDSSGEGWNTVHLSCLTVVVELCSGEGRKRLGSLQNEVSQNCAFSQTSLKSEIGSALLSLAACVCACALARA